MTVVHVERERLNRGMTAGEFAEAAGVTRHVVARLEAGKRVSPSSAKSVAEYLEVQVTDLAPFVPDSESDAVRRAETSEVKEQVREGIR